ncbi:MAG: PQQ-dependent sugar dehydrogenase [Chloroherpetonaceae bacterium]|nr:PQQ-dependent sugar dehydrogenase [Chloroherpetonaceae bacterium]MDW8019805.1 PQQ-dependent sugar dehydrogenase [Chloroherpetonaceae bacterium]
MKQFGILAFVLFCGAMRLEAQVGYTDAFPSLPNFSLPLEMVHAGDGTNRLFVVEKIGRIRVFQNQSGVSSYSTFLDITDRVVTNVNADERGLLGLAFHPNYAANRWFYVYYTRDTVISGVGTRTKMIVARFQASSSNPNVALPNSEYRILQFVKNQVHTNHNGGKIAFGPDGLLYISVGDGGGAGDPQNNAQNVNNLFGKLLRIDVEGDDFPSDNDRNFRIPPTNPFASGGGRPEIFAWGLRNMWKFCIDNIEGIIGGDVGQNAREEIDRVHIGGNYGWRFMEGNLPYNIPNPADTNGLNLVPPIYVYPHSVGQSITGGYVYRGGALPEQVGRYIYGDFVSGRVWSLNLATLTNTLLFQASGINIASFGTDQNNELYFLGFNTGRIYRLTNTASPPSGTAVPGVGVWSALGSGVNGTVRAIAVSGNQVFVGGTFTAAGGTPAHNIARWSPNEGWVALGSGVSGTVNALAIDQNGHLLVGGAFTLAGGTVVNNIARWDGSTWSALGTGTNGYVSAIAVAPNGDVFVGGAFSQAGGVTVNNIARWNGSTWTSLSSGMNNEVRALAINASGELFAGGNFTLAGGTSATNIARWNGTSWSALGTGVNAFVNAMTILQNGDVVAGGIFLSAGGTPVNRIARWNGSTWSPLGAGVSGVVLALTSIGNTLYAAGGFLTAEGRIVNQIARWNGTSWEALGHSTVGANGNINALALSGQTLFAGGSATAFGGISANGVAQLELPNVAEVRAIATGNSSHVFLGTGLQIDFTGVASDGFVSVERYDSPPRNISGVPQANVSSYRFLISQTGLGTFNALLRFNRNEIPNSGIWQPATVRVYRRPTPNTGTFSVLPNAFNPSFPDEVRATTSEFSEFSLGGDSDNPLPVELLSFTGQRTTNGIQLSWTTASELNNAGFIVMRSSSTNPQPVEIASYRTMPELRGRGTTSNQTTYTLLDRAVETGQSYTYRLRSVDLNGAVHDYLRTVTVEWQRLEAEQEAQKVYDYALMQNYPNPFNPTTVIRFTMRQAGKATLTVTDVLGRVVSRMTLDAARGENQVRFNGSGLPSGLYFYQLTTQGFAATRKMMLVK